MGDDGEEIEVLVRQFIEGDEVKVLVPPGATFYDLRLAVSRHVGSRELFEKAHFTTRSMAPGLDSEALGDVREVIMLRAELTVRDDEEAEAWRQELDGKGRPR